MSDIFSRLKRNSSTLLTRFPSNDGAGVIKRLEEQRKEWIKTINFVSMPRCDSKLINFNIILARVEVNTKIKCYLLFKTNPNCHEQKCTHSFAMSFIQNDPSRTVCLLKIS